MSIRKWFNAFSRRTVDSPNAKVEAETSGALAIDNFSESDIFLVGFPKSGNTWMQNLVGGLLYGMDTRFLTDQLTQVLVPNVHSVSSYKRLSNPTCFKSHFLPRPEYRRVVYLVRDGRDAMVSYYHMLKAVQNQTASMSEMVSRGEGVFPCKWHEHVRQWRSNPFDAEILTIRYEDLQVNPLCELKRFCEFANIRRDDELLQRCIDGNSFAQMQIKEAEFGWDNQNWNPDEKFIRRGVVGSFRDEMPAEVISEFEKEAFQQLLDCGYQLFGLTHAA